MGLSNNSIARVVGVDTHYMDQVPVSNGIILPPPPPQFPGAWEIGNATYTGKQATNLVAKNNGFWIRDDGLFLISVNGLNLGSSAIRTFSFNVADDISTLVQIDAVSASAILGGSSPTGVSVTPDGKKLIVSESDFQLIEEVILSTAWSLASYIPSSVSYDVADASAVNQCSVNELGTRLYVGEGGLNSIGSHIFGNPFDVASMSSESKHNVPSIVPLGLHVQPNGQRYWVADSNGASSKIVQYKMGVSGDLTTSIEETSLNISAQATAGSKGIFWKRDGTILYISDFQGNIFQYNVSL